jgi:Transposase DDE domain
VLRLLAAEGMVSLGLLSLDGTKLAGIAAQKANRTLPQIEKLLAEAAATDAAEDARYGDAAGEPTPRALARRAERRERLAQARDRLAAEDQARRDAQRAKQEAWDTAAAAGTRRAGRRPGDEPRANRAGTEPRANITDPDVRVMRNQKGYVAGYNGQAVVTADQVIVGAMLSQHPVDRTLLHPLLDQCRDQLSAARIRPKLRTVLADAGYVSEENFARADQDKLRLLAPLAKDPARPGGRSAKRTRHLDQYPATGRAIRRLRHPRGREDYKMRARTVEPVFGQLKTCQKLTTMSRRGLAACESEWLLACTAHNLRKLYRHRVQGLRSKACHLWPEPKIAQNRHPRAVSHSRISGLTPPRGLCATPGLCIATLWGNRPPLPRRGSSVTATERP